MALHVSNFLGANLDLLQTIPFTFPACFGARIDRRRNIIVTVDPRNQSIDFGGTPVSLICFNLTHPAKAPHQSPGPSDAIKTSRGSVIVF